MDDTESQYRNDSKYQAAVEDDEINLLDYEVNFQTSPHDTADLRSYRGNNGDYQSLIAENLFSYRFNCTPS